jgi:Thioesterase-like superfamily
MADFMTATAVERRGDEPRFEAELDPQWSVGTRLHGGYLLAVLGRAAGRAAPAAHPHLTSITGTFLTPPESGQAQVTVEVLRAGRGVTQLRARLIQQGALRMEALISQGRLTEDDAWWSGLEPVKLPPEADCVLVPPAAPGAGFPVPLMDVIEQRLDPSSVGFTVGEPSRRGVIAGWQRLADGSAWDPLSVLVALDPVPPASYDLGVRGWAPTLSLTAYIRRLPSPGPLRVRLAATEIGGDRMDEVAHAWDGDGRLIGQATQLAAIRLSLPKTRPPPPLASPCDRAGIGGERLVA